MKAILLVRVSTSHQDLEPQKEKVLKWATENGYTETIIVETVESGLCNKKEKIGTAKIFSILKEDPEFNTIICSELSRLSRKESVLHALKDRFINEGIQLIVIGQFKLFNDRGEVDHNASLHFTIWGYFAESEIQQFRERSSNAQISYIKQGLSIPGKAPFGYIREYDQEARKNRLIKDPVNGPIVAKIFNWYVNGLPSKFGETSTAKIARYCINNNLPEYTRSKRNINKLLKTELYTGSKTFVFKGKSKSPITIKVDYIPIVSRDLYNKAQEKLKDSNSRVDKSVKNTLLSKKIRCRHCDTFFVANYKLEGNFNKSSYRCGARGKAIPCINKQTISMSMIDSAIWTMIKHDYDFIEGLKYERFNDRITELNNIIDSNSNRLTEYHNVKDELINLRTLISANIVEHLSKNNDLELLKNIRNLQKQTKKITEEISKINKILENAQEELNTIYGILRTHNPQNVNIDQTLEDIQVVNKYYITDINTVEKNRDILKSYFDLYIKEIHINHHSKKLTILTVYFRKLFSHTHSTLEDKEKYEFEISTPFMLILDKRNTNHIRLFWRPLIGRWRDITIIDDDNQYLYYPDLYNTIDKEMGIKDALQIKNIDCIHFKDTDFNEMIVKKLISDNFGQFEYKPLKNIFNSI